MMPHYRGMRRGLCSVIASPGGLGGAHLLEGALAPQMTSVLEAQEVGT